ncbi:hypothetical protein XELAEV_18006633mg [Xenopus laevis]|uniref:Protein kinase domain-containing protein n=1 Tax=Xenopus laevis TaxID=8355 RepID=A0A974E0H4_XENLA|nr:hypothetical protein XELAEV_18006633mg [Xenopus laevis]
MFFLSLVIKDKEYNAGIDWWSLGLTIYKMANGSHPFLSKFTNAILYKEPCIPKWLNKELQDLLRQLLTKDPKKRLCCNGNIGEHPFFHFIDWVPSVDFSKTIEQPLSFLESIKYKMSSRYLTPASQLEQLSHLWTSRNLCHSQAQPMAINYPCHPAPLSAPFGPFGFPVQPYAAYLPHVGFYQQPLPPVPYNLHPFFGPVIRPPPVPVLVPVSHNLPLDVANTTWPFPTYLHLFQWLPSLAHYIGLFHHSLFLQWPVQPSLRLALTTGYCLWPSPSAPTLAHSIGLQL